MIHIDIEKKLNSLGISITDFENDYYGKISKNQFKIFKEKRDKPLTFLNIYNLNYSSPTTRKSNTQTKTIVEIFDFYYKNDNSFSIFIDKFLKSLHKIYSSPEEFIKFILLLSPSELEKAKIEYDSIRPDGNIIEKLEKIFDYERDRNNIVSVIYKLDFRVCYYCNRNYISNFSNKSQNRTTFTLDHYYQQKEYPLFTLSLYNLIPACSVCNSLIKGKRKVNQYKNPYDKNYDFNKKVIFELISKDKVELSTNDIDCENYIKDFYLNEIYETHKYDIKEFLNKRDIFTDELIRSYATLSGVDDYIVKKSVFGEVIYNDSLDYEPLSKLKKDLASKLKLI
ncbi:hypothetical protein [Aliarcobacter butzleri]|uniref:hypothetical protein n=1 Tax=Aliarcobacter butzleri TaxID=28197 RepID=UPI0024DE1FFA|nr:hypothetical protein [Aliarcobacter butzleri]MDK2050879.1 hypothetical protein [Aliarcobacter butzleri]